MALPELVEGGAGLQQAQPSKTCIVIIFDHPEKRHVKKFPVIAPLCGSGTIG